MPFVTEMDSDELRAHLHRREKEWIVGLTDPLVLRLWEELKRADKRIEELENHRA
jgi:hypothetical protein